MINLGIKYVATHGHGHRLFRSIFDPFDSISTNPATDSDDDDETKDGYSTNN